MPDTPPAIAGRAVFVSYAREDTASAQRIAEALRTGGVEVWLDQEGGLVGGDA
ncbi:MAG: TIR domain-containing protein [Opitutus sp.]|nr:TIR domain-containing protein [Opitutus sp.]